MALLAALPNKGTVTAENPALDTTQLFRPYTFTDTSHQPQEVRTDQSTAALIRVIRKRPTGGAAASKVPAKRPPSSDLQPPSKKLQTAQAGPSSQQPQGQNRASTAGPSKAAQPAVASGASDATRAFSFEQLKTMKAAELKDVGKAKGVKKLSGNKDELIRRILDHQRAAKGGT